MGRKLRRSRAKGKKADFIIANIKAQRGIDRAEHFAKGGDLVQYWVWTQDGDAKPQAGCVP